MFEQAMVKFFLLLLGFILFFDLRKTIAAYKKGYGVRGWSGQKDDDRTNLIYKRLKIITKPDKYTKFSWGFYRGLLLVAIIMEIVLILYSLFIILFK